MADERSYIGITLPIRRSSTGYFEQSVTVIEQIKSNLINLLMTYKGERLFQPEFGSDLHNLLFTQMDAEYDSNVQLAIQQCVSQWMPFVTIAEVEVLRDDAHNKTIAKISFILNNNENNLEAIMIEF